MKQSRWDLLLVLVTVGQVVLLLAPFFLAVPPVLRTGLVIVNAFLVGMNYQCVAHNFIHHPFFTNNGLNEVFSVLNSLAIGLPQSAYRLHHLNHHRYNNDPAKDESSTWRFAKNQREENIFSYSLLGLLRTDLMGLIRAAGRTSALVYAELAVLIFVLLGAGLLRPGLFLSYLLPSLLLGQVFALWENYCEHRGADYRDRQRDSVSCYNGFYNWIWFNNGYHQEHHFRPQVHWTEIRPVRAELPNDRVVVHGCHLTNSFHH